MICWFQFLLTLYIGHFLLVSIVKGFRLKTTPDYLVEPLYYKNVPGEKENIADYTFWNIININRTLVLEGNYTFTQDMDNTFVRGVESAYSSKGNNKFEKLPFRLLPTPLCEFYNGSYRKYIEPHFIGKTNFPTLPPEGLCPIPKGSYWAKGVTIKEELLPLHVPRGLWRLEELFYRTKPKRELVGGLQVFGRVHDRYG